MLAACLAVLEASSRHAGTFRLDVTSLHDRPRIGPSGSTASAVLAASLGSADAVLLVTGVRGPADDESLAALRGTIIASLALAVTIRPVRTLNGLQAPLLSPRQFDWLIVGGIDAPAQSGHGEHAPPVSDHGTVRDIAESTRQGIERVLRHAFQTARSRLRKRLTVVTEGWPPSHGLAVWREIAESVAEGYPDVVVDYVPIHALTLRMTLRPDTLDTIASSSLHADVLSAWAAALAGPPGILASASLNLEGRVPALFEPLQSSALGIGSEGAAHPIAAFWACAMLLNHLGERNAAALVMTAIETVSVDPAVRFAHPREDGHLEAVTRSVLSAIGQEAD